MASLHDQIFSFLKKNENDCDLILSVLYGCKNGDDVTDEISDRFIMDCIEAGFEDHVDRAVQLYKEGEGMNKGYICEECAEACYLTVVYDDDFIPKMPDNCPFGGYETDWKEYKSGEDDE